jgi:hypothetical protein
MGFPSSRVSGRQCGAILMKHSSHFSTVWVNSRSILLHSSVCYKS